MFKKCILLLISIASIISLCACKNTQTNMPQGTIVPTTNSESLLKIHDIGGYKITTDTLTCTIVGDGQKLYLYAEYYEPSRMIECSVDANEVKILETVNGETKYTITDNTLFNLYNPLTTLIKDLNALQYASSEVAIDRDNIYTVYTYPIEQKPQTNKMSFIVSDIKIRWHDEKTYSFKYYDYANDYVAVSETAPQDFNLNDWEVDIDNKIVRHKTNNTQLEITVENISIGYGQPDVATENIKNYSIKVFVNEETGFADKIIQQQTTGEIVIHAINDLTIINDIEILESYIKMTENETSAALLITHTFSMLI